MESGIENMKKCVYCGMDIPANTSRCDYCGSILEVTVDENNYKAKEEDQPAISIKEEEPAEYEVQKKVAADTIVQTAPVQNFSNNNRFDNSTQGYRYNYTPDSQEPLSNGLKVFLTILFTVIPGLGQLAGIITAIVFMNTDDNKDKKSFGVALLVACIIMFVLACIGCFIIGIAAAANNSFNFNQW